MRLRIIAKQSSEFYGLAQISAEALKKIEERT
jgi:hypothetical protein